MIEPETRPPIVKRSPVGPCSDFREYQEPLRHDFWYSCAYCSIAESEAGGIGFEIDHYLPGKSHPDLKGVYENLQWTCGRCNRFKGDYEPTEGFRSRGAYVIRPDEEDPRDHIAPDGERVRDLTPTGKFNIMMLHLNRQDLRRLRGIRQRFCQTTEVVAHGLRILHDARGRLDSLPPGVRPYVLRLRQQARSATDEAHEKIEDLLRQACRSPLLDKDPNRHQEAKARRKYLREVGALVPGCPRFPKTSAKKRRRRR